MRRVRETTVAVEKQQLLHVFVCARTQGHACACVCLCVCAEARACACARLALLSQYATSRRHTVCSLSVSTVFFDIIQ